MKRSLATHTHSYIVETKFPACYFRCLGLGNFDGFEIPYPITNPTRTTRVTSRRIHDVQFRRFRGLKVDIAR